MPSVIRGSDNFDSDGIVEGSAKAWVNFDGTGTVAIRDSFNVSSITDSGTGTYIVNYTTALNNSQYAVLCAFGADPGESGYGSVSTTDVTIETYNSSGTKEDKGQVSVACFEN